MLFIPIRYKCTTLQLPQTMTWSVHWNLILVDVINSIHITLFIPSTHSAHHIAYNYFFGGGGEGPRSRCYGRTAALRLIVQSCDEDDYVFRFSV
jgi:hypothetical protein